MVNILFWVAIGCIALSFVFDAMEKEKAATLFGLLSGVVIFLVMVVALVGNRLW